MDFEWETEGLAEAPASLARRLYDGFGEIDGTERPLASYETRDYGGIENPQAA
jgi:hypothetical protein